MATDRRRFLTYRDLEQEYALKRTTAASMVHRGQLPHVKLGPRNTRFERVEMEAWINARRRPGR